MSAAANVIFPESYAGAFVLTVQDLFQLVKNILFGFYGQHSRIHRYVVSVSGRGGARPDLLRQEAGSLRHLRILCAL